MLNLAIVSPSANEKPETFIQSHINGIEANVTYYYGDLIPRYIRGEGLFSMDNKHLTDIKSWMHLVKRLNLISLKNSKLGFKGYLFAQSLLQHHIDVVLAEYGTCSAEVLPACKYAGIPLVAHFHGRDSSDFQLINEYKEKYKRLFDNASYVIAVSHEMEKRLMALGCPAKKLIYAPCTPDERFFALKPTLEKLQFTFIGRFTDKKAPYAILLAFKKVLEQHSNAKLVMAGNGPLLNSTRNIAKMLSIDNHVDFPGVIAPDQAQNYLLESRAYVQHSIIADDGDMEGTPVAVMEASATGIPVISTKHAGIPDVIIDEMTGLLCNEMDIEKMATDMIRLADDINLARNLGNAGKKRMKEEFSKEWQMKVLTETIKAAVNKK